MAFLKSHFCKTSCFAKWSLVKPRPRLPFIFRLRGCGLGERNVISRARTDTHILSGTQRSPFPLGGRGRGGKGGVPHALTFPRST